MSGQQQEFRPVATPAKLVDAPIQKSESMHPVEAMQKNFAKQQAALRSQTLARVYGSALPAQLLTEERILSQVRRLPVLHSSQLGLATMRNSHEDFGFEDWLSDPRDAEVMVDVHMAQEKMMNM